VSFDLLPKINTDPGKAPVTVEVEWILRTSEVAIGPDPRTIALLRGRWGEVQVRSLRVQFPTELPPDFEAAIAVYKIAGAEAHKRGVLVKNVKGKLKATCQADLPAPIIDVPPIIVNQHKAPHDYFIWAGQREEMRATPNIAIAIVVWANHKSLCEGHLGGV
jgi:hypothetical protein